MFVLYQRRQISDTQDIFDGTQKIFSCVYIYLDTLKAIVHINQI